MDKLTETKKFLALFGMPIQQQADICCYALLALAHIKQNDNWAAATNEWIRIHDILSFTAENYGKSYAENTRETIRKNCLHQYREGAFIEDNGKATNSPNYRYRITDEALQLIRAIGTREFDEKMRIFHRDRDTLIKKYASKKTMQMMPVSINGDELHFSPGKHNALQKDILEQFAPRFAPDCVCLYVGDTIKKDLINDTAMLTYLGFEITLHDKMPDIVLYCQKTNWLYFIEAVTSVGPMSPQRIIEIDNMTHSVTAGKIYVTAFPDFDTYKKFSSNLAWETEVWLSEMPEHMIHLNGDKFLGPHKQ